MEITRRKNERKKGTRYLTLNHRYRLNLDTLRESTNKLLAWLAFTGLVLATAGYILYGLWALAAVYRI